MGSPGSWISHPAVPQQRVDSLLPCSTSPAPTPTPTPGDLILLALAGLAIALAGALGPAVWASASRTTTALHGE